MSNWITITEDLVKTRMSGQEVDALKKAVGNSGQTGGEILLEVIDQVVDEVRGYCVTAVKGGHLQSMGPSNTVPVRLKKVVLNLIRYEFATTVPGMKGLIDELRQKQQDRDVRALERFANGEGISAEDPEGEETAVTVPSPSITGRPKQFGREAQDGI